MKSRILMLLTALLAVACSRNPGCGCNTECTCGCGQTCCCQAQCGCDRQCGCGSCAASKGCALSDSAVVVNTIMARRSIRQYQPEAVRRDQMDVILDCGIHAPSAMNRQPWALRVADNPEFLNACTATWKETLPDDRRAAVEADSTFRNMFRNAPTVVFIGAPENWGDLDCGLLGENMMLAAQSMGIGSCCLGGLIGFMNSDAAADYRKRIDFPEGYRLVYAIAFGYPAESPEAKPRDASVIRYID